MSPYRTLPGPSDRRTDEASDGRVVSFVIAATGTVPFVADVLSWRALGGAATLGLGMLVVGIVGLVRER